LSSLRVIEEHKKWGQFLNVVLYCCVCLLAAYSSCGMV